MGILTASSETAYAQSAEQLYDFVTDPRNWVKVYPGTEMIEGVDELPLKVGDVWFEAGADRSRGTFSWRLLTAVRPSRSVFQSVGRLAEVPEQPESGLEGIMTVSYTFLAPGQDDTLFHRQMTIELPKRARMPKGMVTVFEPANIDAYHDAVGKALAAEAAS